MFIKIRVKTNQKKEEIKSKSKDHFDVWLREKSERNLANKRLIKVVAEHFGLPHNMIHIVKGHHLPNKILSIDFSRKNQ